MRRRNRGCGCYLSAIALVLSLGVGCASSESQQNPQPQAGPGTPEPIVLVVTDPLAKELACACVEGFGQRNYRKLAAYLQSELKRPVVVEFSDDLTETLTTLGQKREVIVVGDRSLVVDGAKRAGHKALPVCDLSGMEGSTTESALFVARADDPAKELKDIAGRKVLVGLHKADEKHAAALVALGDLHLKPEAQLVNQPAGADVGLDVLDSSASPPPVAVIPNHVLRLLEGCGSIRKGSLKVIGSTSPVPFVTLFLSDSIAPETRAAIPDKLLSLKSDPLLLKQLESRDGFLPVKPQANARAEASRDWPDWRGPDRDGRVPKLPSHLPQRANIIWKQPAREGGLAGLCVSDGRLIIAERDLTDQYDFYRCLNAETGQPLWSVVFPARGKLDYGQSPRATPVLRDGKVYVLGAFGGLRCLNVSDGSTVWERDLPRDFQAKLPTWGMCSPPLVVDDLLIVNPGGPEASLVALDCATGRTRWVTPGGPAAYAAFICGEFGGRRQIVGYDKASLGGWDVKTGQRLWRLVPPAKGDFNVATPIAVDGGILVSTENNGTRLYRFDDSGQIIPTPAAQYADLAPDTSTPVVTAGRVFGAHDGLHCLDIRNGLRPVWQSDESLGDYASLFADERRVLVVTVSGELILLNAAADADAIVSRLRLFDDVETYSHPALVGTRLYLNAGSSVVCIDLGSD